MVLLNIKQEKEKVTNFLLKNENNIAIFNIIK